MTDRPWKRIEREVRRMVGITAPRDQFHSADAETECFSYEIKSRKGLPAWLWEALDEARRHRTGDRTPVVVLCERRQGVKTRMVAVLAFEDWCDWHEGRPGEAEE